MVLQKERRTKKKQDLKLPQKKSKSSEKTAKSSFETSQLSIPALIPAELHKKKLKKRV